METIERKKFFTDKHPEGTRDIQLRKLVQVMKSQEYKRGLTEFEVRHRLSSVIDSGCRMLGIQLRTSGQTWYIKSYNEETESIEWQKLSLNRLKGYVLDIAEANGIRSYLTNNVIIINALQMLFNKQLKCERY